MKRITLPETLPVFPLPKALLLPRARLPLHLFEPRYLAMMDDVLKTSERLIGMVKPDRLRRASDPVFRNRRRALFCNANGCVQI